jgi:hypothetical protein
MLWHNLSCLPGTTKENHENFQNSRCSGKDFTWRLGVTVILFSMAQKPLVGQGLLIIKASRSHSVGHTTLDRTPLAE